MFIRKAKSVKRFYIILSVSSLIALFALSFADFKLYNWSQSKSQDSTTFKNYVYNSYLIIFSLTKLAMVFQFFVFLYIMVYYYVLMFAKVKYKRIMNLVYIGSVICAVLMIWYSLTGYLLTVPGEFYPIIIVGALIILTITVALFTFLWIITYNKKFLNQQTAVFLAMKSSETFVFYLGVLLSSLLIRIFWGRQTESGYNIRDWLFIPNYKNPTISERFNSTFIGWEVEYIGLFLIGNYYFTSKYKWYKLASEWFYIIVAVVSSIAMALGGWGYLTDGLSSIIVVGFWYYASPSVLNWFRSGRSGSNRKQTDSTIYTGDPDIDKKIKAEEKKEKKASKQLAKKNAKLNKKQNKIDAKIKKQSKDEAQQEVDRILKNASKEHKKNLKNKKNKNDNDGSNVLH